MAPPAQNETLIQRILPMLSQAFATVSPLLPPLFAFSAKVESAYLAHIAPHASTLLPLAVGFFLLTAGGSFTTVTACAEAARLFGLAKVLEQLGLLRKDIGAYIAASARDDELDEDGNGIKDVQEISAAQLVQRKLAVAARAVNPDRVSKALAGLYSAFTAIIASLRIQMSQAITLGTVIGDVLCDAAYQYVLPPLRAVTAPAYQKWLPVCLAWFCRGVAVSIAFTIFRTVTAFYSALRGAQLLLRGGVRSALRNDNIKAKLPPWVITQLVLTDEEARKREVEQGTAQPAADSDDADNKEPHVVQIDETAPLFAGAVWTLAATGFLMQLNSGFRLPFPLNVLLLPVSMLESFLQYFVAHGSYGVPPPVGA